MENLTEKEIKELEELEIQETFNEDTNLNDEDVLLENVDKEKKDEYKNN